MVMKVMVVMGGGGGDDQGSKVLNVFLTRGGCCKDSNLMQYTDLAQIRAHSLAALNKKTRKAAVLGMLALVQDNNSGSQIVYHYRLDWSTPICRKAFCAVVDITIHRWSSCYFFQIEFLTNVLCTKNQCSDRNPCQDPAQFHSIH